MLSVFKGSNSIAAVISIVVQLIAFILTKIVQFTSVLEVRMPLLLSLATLISTGMFGDKSAIPKRMENFL